MRITAPRAECEEGESQRDRAAWRSAAAAERSFRRSASWPWGRWELIARKSALIVVTNLLGAFLGYLALFLLARFGGTEGFTGAELVGTVGFALGFVGMFTFITDAGLGHAHIKRLSGRELPEAVAIGTFAALRLVAVALMATAVLGSILVWTSVLGRGFQSDAVLMSIYAMLAAALCFGVGGIATGTFQARRESARTQLPILAEGVTRTSLIALAILAGAGLAAILWAYVAAGIAFLLVGMLLFRQLPMTRPTRPALQSYLSFALPLSVAIASTAIAYNADRVVIQLFWDLTEVSLYYAPQRLSALVISLGGALFALLYPTLSRLASSGEEAEFRAMAARAERLIGMICIPPVVFLLAFPEETLNIMLSSAFLPAAPVLQVTAINALLTAIAAPVMAALLGRGFSAAIARITILGAAVYLVSVLVLVPAEAFGIPLGGLGAIGAAWSLLGATAVVTSLLRWTTWRRVGVPGAASIFTFAAAGVGTVLLVRLLADLLAPDPFRFYHLILFALVELGLYLGVLALLGHFTREDHRFFLDTLNPFALLRYFFRELRRGDEPSP